MRRTGTEENRRYRKTVSVKKLSELLRVPVSAVITELMKNGIIATINEEIDFDTASIIASDLGFDTKPEEAELEGKITLENLPEILSAEQSGEEPLAPARRRHHSRSCRPWKNHIARYDTQDQRGRQGSRWHHSAHQRIPDEETRENDHIHRYARTRSVFRYAQTRNVHRGYRYPRRLS